VTNWEKQKGELQHQNIRWGRDAAIHDAKDYINMVPSAHKNNHRDKIPSILFLFSLLKENAMYKRQDWQLF
jgi:hypothetical protein